jgi:endoglucanase
LATIATPEPGELTWNDFWVDTGLSKAELLDRGVTPGTRLIWDATTEQFGPHVVGKALDDRVLLAVLTELLNRVSPDDLRYELTLGCSVQEEIGLIGAFSLTAHSTFAYAIALEIGLADDIPAVPNHAVSLRLGQGPVLIHKDALVHYHHGLTSKLEQVAQAAQIPIQHAVFGSFGSDGAALMKADIPSALIAFPARYTHSPFETAHLGDIAAMVDWLEAFVKHDFAA